MGQTGQAVDANSQAIQPPPIQAGSYSRQIDFTNVSSQLTLQANTNYILKSPDADCYVLAGTNPVASKTTHATAGSNLLLAGEAMLIEMGNYTKLAVVCKTGVGPYQLTAHPFKG